MHKKSTSRVIPTLASEYLLIIEPFFLIPQNHKPQFLIMHWFTLVLQGIMSVPTVKTIHNMHSTTACSCCNRRSLQEAQLGLKQPLYPRQRTLKAHPPCAKYPLCGAISVIVCQLRQPDLASSERIDKVHTIICALVTPCHRLQLACGLHSGRIPTHEWFAPMSLSLKTCHLLITSLHTPIKKFNGCPRRRSPPPDANPRPFS